MVYVLASDFHGNVDAYIQLRRVAEEVKPDRIVLLGDLTDGYGAFPVNNELDRIFYPILAVRGNCDRFGVFDELNLGDKGAVFSEEDGTRRLVFTHGHLFGKNASPFPLGNGDVCFYGHYHYPEITVINGIRYVCVGSMAYPRGGSEKSFCVYDGKTLKLIAVNDGKILAENNLND